MSRRLCIGAEAPPDLDPKLVSLLGAFRSHDRETRKDLSWHNRVILFECRHYIILYLLNFKYITHPERCVLCTYDPPPVYTKMTDYREYARLQNEIISGVLMDMDKLRSMISDLNQKINNRKPHPPSPRPVSVPVPRPSRRPTSVTRPASVPHWLPHIPVPPPGRPPSRRVRVDRMETPLMMF